MKYLPLSIIFSILSFPPLFASSIVLGPENRISGFELKNSLIPNSSDPETIFKIEQNGTLLEAHCPTDELKEFEQTLQDNENVGLWKNVHRVKATVHIDRTQYDLEDRTYSLVSGHHKLQIKAHGLPE